VRVELFFERSQVVQVTMKHVAILLIAVLSSGCGYFLSGKWEDDPENWSRAFHSRQPNDVVVVHSLYWRAPHWTYEAGYLFEIEPSETLRKQLFGENALRRIERTEVDGRMRPCFGDCPEWFVPKAIEEYELWKYADDDTSEFRVLIDKSTGRIFLGDFQV
jgi:hypothetical protein